MQETHLYHYTSFESAVKIIASGMIMFSKMDSINDINEQNGPDVIGPKDYSHKICKILSNYKQISLTTDKKGKCGYDIPAMWGALCSKRERCMSCI